MRFADVYKKKWFKPIAAPLIVAFICKIGLVMMDFFSSENTVKSQTIGSSGINNIGQQNFYFGEKSSIENKMDDSNTIPSSISVKEVTRKEEKQVLNWDSAYPNPEFKDESGEVIKFEGREDLSAVVVNEELYIMGGSGKNDVRESDVWCLYNGNWDLRTKNAEFGGRSGHTSLYFDHKLWVIGGSIRPEPTIQKFTNDVCFSKDGKNWTCKIPDVPFEPRSGHSSVVAPIKGVKSFLDCMCMLS